MSTDLKIYTAAEVANAGISQQKIEEALAVITRKAYRAAKAGRGACNHHAPNLNFLEEVARRLEDFGYTTQITEQAILGPTITIRWNTKEAGSAPADDHDF